jgi:hypothetical protein
MDEKNTKQYKYNNVGRWSINSKANRPKGKAARLKKGKKFLETDCIFN